jgi:hypothetical protein
MSRSSVVVGAVVALPIALAASRPSAQTIIQYDDIQADAQAAITCGFCATEKFGAVFYELGGGGGLPASAFPLTLNAVQVAVASTQVTGSLGTYQCNGTTTGGNVNATMEVYAGATVPATITNLPASGAWPGEVEVVPPSQVGLELSADTAPGANQFDVRINSLAAGVTVPAGNTYLRVVVSIPSGGASASCADLGFSPPAFSPFRDHGRVAPRRSFIYQLGFEFPPISVPAQWTWVENVTDPITGQSGIDGDWLLRLDITPAGVTPDAGVTDSGPTLVDAGEDSGIPADAGEVADAGGVDATVEADAGTPDSGVGLPPPVITDISPDQIAFGSSGSVTIVGTGFAQGVAVRLGEISLQVRLLSGSTTVQVDVPSGIAAGTYDVVVTNPDGQAAIKADAFTVKGAEPPGLSPEGCRCVGSPGGAGAWAGLGLVALWAQRRRRRPTT